MIPQWKRESRNPSSSSSALFSKHKFQQRISTFLGRVSTEEKEVFERVPCSISSLYLILSVSHSRVLPQVSLFFPSLHSDALFTVNPEHTQGFPFSTFCYSTALFQNGWVFFLSKFNESHNSLRWQCKTFGRFFLTYIQIESMENEKSHISYSQPLLNTLSLFHVIYLSKMTQVSSPFWQFPSFVSLSSLKLHPVEWETSVHNHF